MISESAVSNNPDSNNNLPGSISFSTQYASREVSVRVIPADAETQTSSQGKVVLQLSGQPKRVRRRSFFNRKKNFRHFKGLAQQVRAVASEIEQQLKELEERFQLKIDDRASVLGLMRSNSGLIPLLRDVVTTIEGDYRNCLFTVSVDELDPSQLFVKIFRDEYPKGFGQYLREYRKKLIEKITSDGDARLFIYTGFGPKPI